MATSSSQPTTQELARRFANLREAAGIDRSIFAARAGLDPSIVEELEAGTRTWTLDDLQAYAKVLAISLSTILAEWDDAERA